MPYNDPEKQRENLKKWRDERRKLKASESLKPAKKAAKGHKKALAVKLTKVSLCEWANKHFPERFVLQSAPCHRILADTLEDVIRKGGNYAFALPRGSAKSTWLEMGVIYAILEGFRRYVVLVGGNAEMAAGTLDRIKGELETNSNLERDYPEVIRAIKSIEGIGQRARIIKDAAGNQLSFAWTSKKITLPAIKGFIGAGAIVCAKGVDGNIRGLNEKMPDGSSVRPDLVLVDDPQTREDAQSPTTVAKREETIKGDLLGLAGPGKKIAALIAGTIIVKSDIMDRLVDRKANPVWQGIRISMVEKWSDAHKTLWLMEYASLRKEAQEAGDRSAREATLFYRAHREEMDKGAKVYWPDRYNRGDEISALQSAYNLLIDNGEAAFYSEYQNDPVGMSSNYYDLTPETVLKRLNGRAELALPSLTVSITAAVDLNRYGLTWVILASTPTMASSIIAYGVYVPEGVKIFEGKRNEFSEAEQLAFWKAMDSLMRRFEALQIVNAAGVRQRLRRVGIDAGYLYQTVRQFCAQNQARYPFEIYPTRGRSSDQFTPSGRNVQEHGDSWIKTADLEGELVVFDVDTWKERSQQGFILPCGAPGSVDIWGDPLSPAMHRDLASHIAAERMILKTETTKGTLKYMWTVSGRNDFLDALNIARAMASVGGCNAIRSYTPEPSKAQEPAVQETQPKQPVPQPVQEEEGVSYDRGWGGGSYF